MAKEYIRKALAEVSRQRTDVCDHIAYRLSELSSGQVRDIDAALNFGWVSWNTRGIVTSGNGFTHAQTVEMRRACQLLARLFPTMAGPMNVVSGQTMNVTLVSQGWDSQQLSTVLGHLIRGIQRPQGTGHYLKGSYWGFSSHNERAWTAAAWREAGDLLDYGIALLTRNDEDVPGRVITRWFGTGDRTRVQTVLATTRTHMSDRLTGIVYQGPGMSKNTNYREVGPRVEPGVLTPEPADYGYASPQTAECTIGFGSNFFSTSLTVERRRTLHDPASRKIGCSRGGAMLHELTHRHARTNDVRITQAVYTRLAREAPADENARAIAYGPWLATALALDNPELAITNADTYRMFCEDAQAYAGGARL